MRKAETYVRMFWARVRKSEGDGCWEWNGAAYRNGYGKLWWMGVFWMAHRLSYAIAFSNPGDMQVCHRCDNRKCVRPDHLFLGTARDNVMDMVRKGRNRPTRGERCGNAKLTTQDVLTIRSAVERGATHKEVAAKYGVSAKQISVIVSRKQWAHVAPSVAGAPE